MADYISYPFKTMNITQTYLGTVSHYPHTTGRPKDYPIDEACENTGRSPMYAPCDVKVVRIYGVGSKGTNTLWVTSTAKVKFANGKTDYLSMQITHPNDSDLKKLKVGQVIKKGTVICCEGTDGATGNHIHLSAGMGTITNGGWVQNSNGKWVLTTSGGTVKPEQAFYLDSKFTKVKNAHGLTFKALPTVKTVRYKVATDTLNVRKGAGTSYAIAGVLHDRTVVEITTTKTVGKVKWGKLANGNGWICLKYCKKEG